MKSKMIFTLTVLFFTTQLFSQIYKIPLNQKIRKASLIVEGKVVDTKSYIGNDGRIYTVNKIKVYKSFKGTPLSEHVSIITRGGRINGKIASWSHLLTLNKEDAGIFTLIETNRPFTDQAGFSNEVYEVYSSEQGFFKYRFEKNNMSAFVPFEYYEDIEEELFNPLRQQLGIPIIYDIPEWELEGFGEDKCIVYKFDVTQSNPQNPLELEALVSIKSTQGQFYLYQSAIISEYNTSILGQSVVQSGVLQLESTGVSALSSYDISASDLANNKLEAKVISNTSSVSSMFLLDENFSPLIKLKVTLQQFGDPEIIIAQSEMQQFSEFYNPDTERPERFECIRIEGDFDSKFTCAPPVITSFSPGTVRAGAFDTLSIFGMCFDSIRGSSRVEFTNSKDGGSPIDWVEPLEGDYVFWSDNLIKVIVPSFVPGGIGNSAGSGLFRVNRGVDGIDTSSVSLIVRFSAHNQGTLFFDTPSQSSVPVYIGNYNGNGGQSIYYSSDFKAYPDAVEAFERALIKWRCATLVNYIVEDSIDIEDLGKAGRIDFESLGDGVLAATFNLLPDYENCDSSGVIVGSNREDFIIEFNSKHYWHTDTLMPPLGVDFNVPDTFDLESRAMHEIGHVVLLKHSNAANDLMHYADVIAPTDYRREFDSNDIEGGLYVVDISSNLASDSCQTKMIKISLSDCSSLTTDILELSSEVSIKIEVFPNPTDGKLTLHLQSDSDIHKWKLQGEIFDITGRKLMSQTLSNEFTSFEVRQLPSGFYFLSIRDKNDYLKTFKIIKE